MNRSCWGHCSHSCLAGLFAKRAKELLFLISGWLWSVRMVGLPVKDDDDWQLHRSGLKNRSEHTDLFANYQMIGGRRMRQTRCRNTKVITSQRNLAKRIACALLSLNRTLTDLSLKLLIAEFNCRTAGLTSSAAYSSPSDLVSGKTKEWKIFVSVRIKPWIYLSSSAVRVCAKLDARLQCAAVCKNFFVRSHSLVNRRNRWVHSAG